MTSRLRLPLPPPAPRPRGRLGVAIAAAAIVAACKQEPPPGAERPPPPVAPPHQVGQVGQVGTPTLPTELSGPLAASGSAAPSASTAPALPEPYAGPYLVVTDASAGVYGDTAINKKSKIGYLRSGSRVPILAGAVPEADCPKGWYRLRDGGFVCGAAGTTNVTSPEARFAIRSPDLGKVLPYTYARNAKHGTPLYRSVPTLEQMREYEPYLAPVKKSGEDEGASAAAKPSSPGESATKAEESALPFSKEALDVRHGKAAGGSEPRGDKAPAPSEPRMAERPSSPDGGAEDPEKPWWQRHDADKRLHEVKLDELEADADAILAKRMVKGFYVAVDREFNWNGRRWYKTTKGLVAPAERFWVTQASEFHGSELDGEHLALPVAWTYGWQKGRPKVAIEPGGKIKAVGALDNHALVALTGKETEISGKKYVEAKEGFWVLASQLRITTPGPPPVDLGPNERWIDVNLTTQTLVAFEGTRAVYATLISSGKESRDKEKDHRTPTGDFRIREKHVTTTMDGDGTAAGDLPYSIEDVPYVMYFHRAYALHGAFWHSNYGAQMSHGCVNLSPLDAKWVFLFTEPHLPEGWHGVWATAAHPGSRVVVHDDAAPRAEPPAHAE